jgi:hypothetical protein
VDARLFQVKRHLGQIGELTVQHPDLFNACPGSLVSKPMVNEIEIADSIGC